MEPDPIQAIAAGTDGPDFSAAVPENGYRWWYIDGISDDGKQAIVIIAFLGSVFSPYYYSARAAGRGDPENYCAINVALYGRSASRWCMTERDRPSLSRSHELFQVGPSRLRWDGSSLVVDVNERSMPFFRAVRGTIRLRPTCQNSRAFALDRNERHIWQPLAPSAEISVVLSAPRLSWKGEGYFDMNHGTRPLEADFRSWSWSRSKADAGVDIRYNVLTRDSENRGAHLRFNPNDDVSSRPVAPPSTLPKGIWRVQRHAHTDRAPVDVHDLEDTPFYTRSLLQMNGARTVMHEFLDMQRFEKRWVRTLLPFRMPRRRWSSDQR